MFMLKVAELFWKMDTNINTEESPACVRALLRLGADFFFFFIPLGKLDQTLSELRKGQKLDVTYICGDSLVRFNVVTLFISVSERLFTF